MTIENGVVIESSGGSGSSGCGSSTIVNIGYSDASMVEDPSPLMDLTAIASANNAETLQSFAMETASLTTSYLED